mgnify:CR=1 FL=1
MLDVAIIGAGPARAGGINRGRWLRDGAQTTE